MGISPEVNVIVRLEFELAYFAAAVQNFSDYAREPPTMDQIYPFKIFLYSIRILQI